MQKDEYNLLLFFELSYLLIFLIYILYILLNMNDDFTNNILNKISDLIDEKLNKFYEKISNNFLKIVNIENDIQKIKERIFENYPLENVKNILNLNNDSEKELNENQETIQDETINNKEDIKQEKNFKNYSCKFDNREKKISLKIKKEDVKKNDIKFSFKVTNNGEISWPENCFLISNNEEITFDKILINEGKPVKPNETVLISTIIKIKNIKEGKLICTSYIIDNNNNKIGNDIGYFYIEIENDNIPIKDNIDEKKIDTIIDEIKKETKNELNEDKIKELEEQLDENLNTSSIFSEEEIRNAILESNGDLEKASKILFPD